jgi:TP901 family phage tail tape measure protein
MAKDIVFIFKALDAYSATAEKIAGSTDKVKDAHARLSKQLIISEQLNRKFTNPFDKMDWTFFDAQNRAAFQQWETPLARMLSRTKDLKNESHSLLGVMGRLATAATLIQIGTQGFRGSMRHEDAVADLRSITLMGEEQAREINAHINKVSPLLKRMPDEMIRAVADTASAKSELLNNTVDLMRVTEASALLANATGMTVPEAVNAAVGSLNMYGASADNVTKFVDVLAAGAAVGAARVESISASLEKVGSTANAYKVSFSELNTLLQILGQNKLTGEPAGTQLKGILLTLETEFMNGKYAPSKVGILKSLEMLKEKDYSPRKLLKLFDRENINTANILLANLPLYRQWITFMDENGMAAKQAAMRTDTLSYAWTGFLSRLQITTNEGLAPANKQLKEMLNNLTADMDGSWMKGLGEGLEGALVTIEALASLIKEVSGFLYTVNVEKDFSKAVSDFDLHPSWGRMWSESIDELDKNLNPFYKTPMPSYSKKIEQQLQTDISNTLGIAPFDAKSTVEIKVSAPPGVVKSARVKSSNVPLKVGLNMESAL